ncbi:hypothetical protein BDQ17DRAFT_1410690 [Cyathus striatus]|nr:hypothetical protein BDQ17DRAFT_1410690 [Cyathus striatus]
MELQWSWNRIKFLYLVTRYSITIDLLLLVLPYILPNILGVTPGGCQPNKILYCVTILVPTIGITIAHAILSISTRAILGQKRTYIIFLWIISALSTIGTAVTLGLHLKFVQIDNGCWHIPVGGTAWILGPFSILLIISTIHVIMLSIEPVRAYLYGGGSHLLWTIYQNGLLYYWGMFALGLCTIIVSATVDHDFWIFLA